MNRFCSNCKALFFSLFDENYGGDFCTERCKALWLKKHGLKESSIDEDDSFDFSDCQFSGVRP